MKVSQACVPSAVRVPKLLFPEAHVVGLETHVLHYHRLVTFELGISWQAGAVERQHLFAINGDLVYLTALLVCLGLVALMLRRVIGGGHRARFPIRLDQRLTRLALQPVDLIPQRLAFSPQGTILCRHLFHQIEQADNALAGLSQALQTVQIKIETFDHALSVFSQWPIVNPFFERLTDWVTPSY
jgi:hypothetical protein